MTKRVVLIGHPVAHSLSAAMQQAAFDDQGIDASYELWDRPPLALSGAIAEVRGEAFLGANVTILDRSIDRMRHLEEILAGRVSLVMSSSLQIEESVKEADVVIGAVLIPGALAPKLVTRAMIAEMKDGSVFADVAIDQGGCAETSRPTTHSEPVYKVDGVTHYCVANMPGAVPITSTKALTNATLPYVEAIADHGLADAVARDQALARGVNVLDGKVTYEAVADAHDLDYAPLEDVLRLSAV